MTGGSLDEWPAVEGVTEDMAFSAGPLNLDPHNPQ